MDFGVMMFPTEYSVAPDELAAMVEQRGYESLFFTEHTHIPASRATPYPAGGELPREYWHTYDPFIALTAAAAATERLRIATGICLVVERDPITTAKEVASLDQLSGGRLLFGVGAGWNLEEMANHGTDGSRRFGVLRERIEAMKTDLGRGGGELPRRARRFRRDLVVPEAAATAAPADSRGRQRAESHRARALVRRRVDAQRDARRGGAPAAHP